jgi:hypothetical protein
VSSHPPEHLADAVDDEDYIVVDVVLLFIVAGGREEEDELVEAQGFHVFYLFAHGLGHGVDGEGPAVVVVEEDWWLLTSC